MYNTIITFLVDFLYQTASLLDGQLGWAIIAITLVIRVILLPIILPSIKSQKKLMDLKPEIDKLKKKYGKDKEVFAKKQMELYQEHGVNPLGGCLPQLVQIGLFIVFYQVLRASLNDESLNLGTTHFFWLNLTEPDKTYILPLLAGLSQFLLGIMLLPATDTKAQKKLASKTVSPKDDESALDADAMAKTMQSQMVFVMPIFTLFLATSFPSGLALYWVVSTLFSLAQQYAVSGLGGIKPYLIRFGIIK